VARAKRPVLAGTDPLAPRRKWRAITLSTLLLAPAYWSLVIGVVSETSDRRNAPLAAPYIAFGLALLPFVFLLLAFLSEHPRAAGATAKALAYAVVVGAPVAGLAGDPVTGFVAGVGAGGIATIRADAEGTWRARGVAVIAISVSIFVLVRTVTVAGVLLAPVLPFTAIGVTDHVVERRRERDAARDRAR
jgi:hypothetical protein